MTCIPDKNTCLETARLLLRPWQEADAEALYQYAGHPAVGPAAGWPPHTSVAHSLEIIRTVFAAPETYAVVLKATGEPVGCVGLIRGDGMHSAAMQADEAEIGYWIGVPYWGQGLMPEAVCCLLQRCFVDGGVSAVWGGHYAGNHRSRRVLEKCGFTYHHTEVGQASPGGDACTQHFLRITAGEWEAAHPIREVGQAGRTAELISRLISVWDGSVRVTHHFLTEQDIASIRPAVKEALQAVDTLVVSYDGQEPVGFMSLQDRKIEALFLAPGHIRKGIGKQLLLRAIHTHKAIYVDVNEQNTHAEGVYRHLGFQTFQRDETDGQGNPFPILHMRLMTADGVGPAPSPVICPVTGDKKRYLSLLLLADEQESMIDRYLERGALYVMLEAETGSTLAVAVVTQEGEGVCELKNLAVAPLHQHKGLGRLMVGYLCRRYQDSCHTLLVGTGDTPQTMGFYQSCGFVYSHTVPDFFTRHYDHPIVEGGRQLRDMVYLKKQLGERRMP